MEQKKSKEGVVFSPTPWHSRVEDHNTHVVVDGKGERVASIVHPYWDDRATNNARLISLAPEMFKALVWIENVMRGSPEFAEYATTDDGDEFQPLGLARSLISRAKGANA